MNRDLWLYQALKKEVYAIIEPFRKKIPVDIHNMTKRLGVVLKEEILPVDVSGAIKKEEDTITIYYDITEDETRQRFTIAHELSHYLLGHLEEVKYLSENILLRSNRLSNTQERDANYLAAELLMPMTMIDSLIDNNSLTLSGLAQKLHVSEQAVSIRLGIT